MGRLWKATRGDHVLLVEAGWSRVGHLKSCLGLFIDVVAMVE